MRVEEMALRSEIRQMLNEAGFNKNTLKIQVKEVLREEIEKAVRQAVNETDFDSYVKQTANSIIRDAAKSHLKNVITDRLVSRWFNRMDINIDIKDEDGELLFGESHVMCNLFSIKALEKIAEQELPYHSAHKKINYIGANGKLVEAKEPNAYKFEQFIFDGFKYFNGITLLRGKREDDFAPIKNKEGVDSPETAIELYNNLYK